MSYSESKPAITIFMAGDSTMSIKDPKDYPETGWGMPFATFFDDQVSIKNYSKNGRSTRTFRDEGLWKLITDEVSASDYVIIQFGHNDEVESKVDRYTTPSQYKNNLKNFIKEANNKGAQAILLTPVTRRYFNDDGTIQESHPYSPLVKEVAKELEGQANFLFFDMDNITRDYFQSLGDEKSALRFMHIQAGQHPNYPNGIRDNTHFNELGARETAQLFLQTLQEANHPIAKRLRSVDPKHLNYRY